MSEIVNLEPRIVWEQFDAITQVPRPSKKEGKIIEFLVDFARKHNIEYKKDAIGNVVMRKPATTTRSARTSTAGGSGPKVRRWVPTAASAWLPHWPS